MATSIRAVNLRRALDELGAFLSADRARVLAAVRPASLRTIETTPDVGWIDIAISAELNDAVLGVVGQAALRRWARDIARVVFKRSILSGLVESALRLFGVSPNSVFKGMPRGWNATYRDAGHIVVETLSPRSLRIHFHDLPAAMCSASYLEMISGGLETIFDLCGVAGHIAVEATDPVRMVAKW